MLAEWEAQKLSTERKLLKKCLVIQADSYATVNAVLACILQQAQ